MSQHTYWWPGKKGDQVAWLANCLASWPGIGPRLGYSPERIAEISLLLIEFMSVLNEVGQSQASMKALNSWADELIYGGETNLTASAPPVLVSPATPTISGGFFSQLKRWRLQVMANTEYSPAVGEALGLVGAAKSRLAPELIVPQFTVTPSSGFYLNFVGSMQGFEALNVEYLRSGTEVWEFVGFLTQTPGKLRIDPANNAPADTGLVRCSFFTKNQKIGNYSPGYAVTIS